MIKVSRNEPIYKALVDAGLIASNQDAKRLMRDKAITVNLSGKMKDIAAYITPDCTMADLKWAAENNLWLRIGKKWIEQLSLGKEASNEHTAKSSHPISISEGPKDPEEKT